MNLVLWGFANVLFMCSKKKKEKEKKLLVLYSFIILTVSFDRFRFKFVYRSNRLVDWHFCYFMLLHYVQLLCRKL